jgi:hypothetical protein
MFIGEPSNTNSKVYFDRNLDRMWLEHDKSCILKFKIWKQSFCFWMESIWLGHIYHMINNDSSQK